MDRDEALAIAFANLKGPRDKDYMATAEALAFLRSLPEYPSNAAVGQALGVSGEIVREFIALTRLPPSIQSMFRDRLLKLEHGRRLAQLAGRMPNKIMEAAEAMADLSALDSRDFILYLLGQPDLSVTEAKQRVLGSRTVTEEEFHVVAVVNAAEFQSLSRRARKARKPVGDLVSSIVREWLAQEQA